MTKCGQTCVYVCEGLNAIMEGWRCRWCWRGHWNRGRGAVVIVGVRRWVGYAVGIGDLGAVGRVRSFHPRLTSNDLPPENKQVDRFRYARDAWLCNNPPTTVSISNRGSMYHPVVDLGELSCRAFWIDPRANATLVPGRSNQILRLTTNTTSITLGQLFSAHRVS